MVRKRYGYVHGPIIRLKIVWATLTKLWIQWSGLQVDQPASVDYWKSPDEGDPDGAQDYPAGDYADTVDDLQSNIVYTLAMRPKVFEHNTSNGAIMRTAHEVSSRLYRLEETESLGNLSSSVRNDHWGDQHLLKLPYTTTLYTWHSSRPYGHEFGDSEAVLSGTALSGNMFTAPKLLDGVGAVGASLVGAGLTVQFTYHYYVPVGTTESNTLPGTVYQTYQPDANDGMAALHGSIAGAAVTTQFAYHYYVPAGTTESNTLPGTVYDLYGNGTENAGVSGAALTSGALIDQFERVNYTQSVPEAVGVSSGQLTGGSLQ